MLSASVSALPFPKASPHVWHGPVIERVHDEWFDYFQLFDVYRHGTVSMQAKWANRSISWKANQPKQTKQVTKPNSTYRICIFFDPCHTLEKCCKSLWHFGRFGVHGACKDPSVLSLRSLNSCGPAIISTGRHKRIPLKKRRLLELSAF